MCFGGGDAPEQEESAAKLAMAETAATMYNRYQNVFVPLENMYIKEAVSSFEPGNYAPAQGQAASLASSVYEPQIADARDASFARGLDPTSGAFKAESDALRQAQARATGEIVADAGLGVTDQGFQKIGNVVRMGQGLLGEATEGLTDVAKRQQEALESQAERDFMNSSSKQQAFGTVAGMGAGYGLNKGYT